MDAQHPDVSDELVEGSNSKWIKGHRRRYNQLAELLSDRQIDIEDVVSTAATFEIAIPSWGMGQGGTRFGRFPVAGEPRNLSEKICDAAVVHRLSGVTPRISLHIPWDRPDRPSALRREVRQLGLSFDAINSNTFQDQPDQPCSYKFGSLSHTDASVRQQAIEHNIECIEIGKAIGSKALTVWLADGGSFPGQQHLRRALDRG